MLRTGIMKRAQDSLRRAKERQVDSGKRFIAASGFIDHRPDYRYGFFGELGYGLIGWLPYLKYLSDKVGPIKTMGLEGTTPFWEFSSDHVEISIEQADMWGDRKSALLGAEYLGQTEHLVAPLTAEGYKARDVSINGFSWKSLELHKNITGEHYSPLDLIGGFPKGQNIVKSPYVAINVKNYFNWGNSDIPNLYAAHEIKHIATVCESKGIKVVLNRFPAARETTNIYLQDSHLDSALAHTNIVDMSPIYEAANSQTERNSIQVTLLSCAEHVFASQGGNAVLALLSNKSVTVLMRGGYDYPDYTSLAKIYSADLDIIYEVKQSKYLST